MPKSSRIEAMKTREKIIAAAYAITLSEGFHKASLGRLAKETGITRSGIGNHFKRKALIAECLEPLFIDEIESRLCSGNPEEFIKSWKELIDTDRHFADCVTACFPVVSLDKGIGLLKSKIEGTPEEVEMCISQCVGYAVVNR